MCVLAAMGVGLALAATLYDWSERTLGQIQRRFDAYDNGYRAQVERLVGDHVRQPKRKAPFVAIWRAWLASERSRLWLPDWQVSLVKAHCEQERNETTC